MRHFFCRICNLRQFPIICGQKTTSSPIEVSGETVKVEIHFYQGICMTQKQNIYAQHPRYTRFGADWD